MATVTLYAQDCLTTGRAVKHSTHLTIGEWCADRYFDRYQEGIQTPFTVYEGNPSEENDITFDIDRMMNGYGEYVVIETPADGVTAALVVSLIVTAVAVSLVPDPTLPENVNRSQESPNNQLGSRRNRARPLERVPDIKGQLLSIPDLIAPTYSTYENNLEVEHGFYCVGRKRLDIQSLKDGDTPLNLIDESSAGIYYPGNSPNIGAPDVAINGHISEPVLAAYRNNQVNNLSITSDFVTGAVDFSQFPWNVGPPFAESAGGNLFRVILAPVVGWPTSYEIGDDVDLIDVILADLTDISGTYEIVAIQNGGFTENILVLDYGLPYPFGTQDIDSGIVRPSGTEEFSPWFYSTAVEFNQAILNVRAPNGMYIDDGGANLQSRTVQYQFEIEGVDAAGTPDGNVTSVDDFISGDDQNPKGKTTTYTFSVPTRFRVRMKRITQRYSGSGAAVEGITFADQYGILDISNTTFGDTTLIQTLTRASPSASAIAERELNCIATELVDEYLGNGVFAGVLSTNTRAVQSFISDALDPVIGNLTLNDIDADGMLAIESDIDSYFGSSSQSVFSYTFDSTDITFQQHSQIIFDAIHCFVFRESAVIKAIFEQPQVTPAFLFTHRSKIPGSEGYTRNFNTARLNDGVEFNWVNPNTNTTETIYIPSDRSAKNPKKFNIAGIRNEQQAIIRAAREYNKILYSKERMTVTTTAEGRYVKPNEMISVVKGTRVYTEDGEVLAQNGMTLTLSQNVVFEVGEVYSVVLKNADGSTEGIIVNEGPEPNQVILAALPSQAIRTGIDSRRTEFSFANEARAEAQLWLPQEIDISDKITVNITAINYSDEYYKDDGTNLKASSDGFSDGFS